MKFSMPREALLGPISQVVNVVERRQTLPVLANFLIEAVDEGLRITGTDMEVELVAKVHAEVAQPGSITVPARKLVDICRALPEGVQVNVQLNKDKLVLHAGRSRFTTKTFATTSTGCCWSFVRGPFGPWPPMATGWRWPRSMPISAVRFEALLSPEKA
jgi:DNA polymerase-3 subunit beta